MPRLVFVSDRFTGHVHLLVEGTSTVGRGPANRLCIPDPSVSTEHCLLLVNGEEVIVRECNSSNGTFVDGVRVVGQAPVRSGQAIRFGTVVARVEIEANDEPTQSEEATAVWAHQRTLERQRTGASATAPAAALGPAWQGEEATVVLARGAVAVAPAATAAAAHRVAGAPGGASASAPVRSRRLLWAAGLAAVVLFIVLVRVISSH